MKLSERPQKYVFVDGKKFRVRPYFNRILDAIEILDRPDYTESMKISALKRILIRGICKNPAAVINAIISEWIGIGDKNDTSMPAVDFSQDANLIYAAFMQAYGIDLHREIDRMHWATFSALFQALPDDTKISQIIDIRTRKIPERNKYNAKEIENLMRLKSRYRVKLSPERESARYQSALHALAEKLISAARGGIKNE